MLFRFSFQKIKVSEELTSSEADGRTVSHIFRHRVRTVRIQTVIAKGLF